MPARPQLRADPLAPVTVAVAGAAFACLLWLHLDGGTDVLDVSWAASLDLRLHFRLDGLGALYALLASGVGLVVLAYSLRYVPLHLEHQGRSQRDGVRFHALMLLFLGAMVGLATAQDLILLFLFFDLTAVCSYFLIGFDRHEAESRWAALMALIVTGTTAVLLLVGALVLYAEYGTFQLPELFERAEAGSQVTLAGVLIALAALAKSAQVPFHFWLPRAMTAPTPVSAYLHSAAMVAAGVLLIGRTLPLLAHSSLVLDLLLAAGIASIAVGGVLALAADGFKRVLAYSTISQYGYVVFLYGLGSASAAAAAAFYVIAHGIAKSALFLTAGAVTECTGGATTLSDVGGLRRRLPLLAGASAVAAATVAALPLTVGFFADELLFKAAVEAGTAAAVVAVGAATLTIAYLGRFWASIFLGRPEGDASRAPALLAGPVVALAAVAAVGGVVPGPLAKLAAAAAESSTLGAVSVEVAYHPDLRAENVMALTSYAAGAVLLALLPALANRARRVARLGARLGPERGYGAGVAALHRLSNRLYALEVRDLRTRVSAVLIPAGALVLVGLVASPTSPTYSLGKVAAGDIALLLALVLTGLAGLAATIPRRHLTLALTLASVGYALAAVYALAGAPDVALVAVIVETLLALLFVGVFALVPAEVLEREATLPARGARRWRDPLTGAVAGVLAFLLAWSAFSRPSPDATVAQRQIELTPDAHAGDTVTAILADFRGLDTLGEISVVAVALTGVVALLRGGRLW